MMQQKYENKMQPIKLDFELSRCNYKEALAVHVEKNWPFILYNDKENYAKYYPSNFMVEFCQDGNIINQVCADENKYQLSIALSATLYNNFHSLSPVIECESDYKQSSTKVITIQ